MILRFIITLTPFIPLSLEGEGEDIKKEGLSPLSNTPYFGYSFEEGGSFS